MSGQDKRGGQPGSTDENAPAAGGRMATGRAEQDGERNRTTGKNAGTNRAEK